MPSLTDHTPQTIVRLWTFLLGLTRRTRLAARMRALILFAAALMAAQAAAQMPEQDLQNAADKVHRALTTTAGRLQTGVYRAEGTTRTTPFGPAGARRFQIFSAFDEPQGKLRFDRIYLVRKPRSPDDPSAEPGPEMPSDVVGGKVIFLPDVTMRWHFGENRQALLGPPTAEDALSDRGAPMPLDGVVQPFRVQPIGLGGSSLLERGRSFQESVGLLRRPMTSCEVLEGRYYRCRWELQPAAPTAAPQMRIPVRFEVIFDSRAGFRPVRYAQFIGTNGMGEWRDPRESATAAWIEKNGAWVPSKLTVENRDRKSVTIQELRFDWESVNEPVADEHFTLTGLGIPESVRIVDTRGGEARTVRP